MNDLGPIQSNSFLSQVFNKGQESFCQWAGHLVKNYPSIKKFQDITAVTQANEALAWNVYIFSILIFSQISNRLLLSPQSRRDIQVLSFESFLLGVTSYALNQIISTVTPYRLNLYALAAINCTAMVAHILYNKPKPENNKPKPENDKPTSPNTTKIGGESASDSNKTDNKPTETIPPDTSTTTTTPVATPTTPPSATATTPSAVNSTTETELNEDNINLNQDDTETRDTKLMATSEQTPTTDNTTAKTNSNTFITPPKQPTSYPIDRKKKLDRVKKNFNSTIVGTGIFSKDEALSNSTLDSTDTDMNQTDLTPSQKNALPTEKCSPKQKTGRGRGRGRGLGDNSQLFDSPARSTIDKR